MNKIIRQIGVMEPETIEKNGVSLKDRTDKRNLFNLFIRGMSCIIILFMVAACGNNDNPSVAPPPVPTGVSAKVVGNTVQIEWQSVYGPGYDIEKSATGNSDDFNYLDFTLGYTTAASAETMPLAYSDAAPLTGNNYYRIRAWVAGSGNNPRIYSDYSSVVSCNYSPGSSGSTTAPAAPTGLTATLSGSNMYLTWNSVSNATSYYVYWASSTTSGKFRLGNTTATNYLDDGLMQGDNYYWVTAVNSAGESNYSSYAYYKNGSGGGGGGGTTTAPPAPTGVTAIQSGAQIIVSWNSVSQASTYIVWYMSPMQTLEDFVTAYTNSYTFIWNNPVSGTYSFKVYSTNSSYVNSTSYGSASCYYTASGGGGGTGGGGGGTTTTKLATPTGLQAASGLYFVQITFNAVSLANSYQLYRSTSASGAYSQINVSVSASQPGNEWIMTDPSPLTGTSYYKVQAIPLSSMTNLTASDLSSYVSITR